MNIFTRFFANRHDPAEIQRALIRRESELARGIFGPVPNGVHREFFCLDEKTWIWHEETKNSKRVTKYLVRDRDVVKSVNGGSYQSISREELVRFKQAVAKYGKIMSDRLYAHTPA
jgi:hypothetical protein